MSFVKIPNNSQFLFISINFVWRNGQYWRFIIWQLLAITREQLTTSTASFEQRDYVIRELIDTESNYLDVLNAVNDKFMQPLEKLLTRDEIKAIFPKTKVRRNFVSTHYAHRKKGEGEIVGWVFMGISFTLHSSRSPSPFCANCAWC